MRNSEDKPEWSQRFSLVFQTAKCILHILKQLSIVCLDFCFTIFDGVLKNNTSSVQTSLEKPLILKTTLFCHCYIFFNLRIKHLQTGQMYLHVWITLLLIVLLRYADYRTLTFLCFLACYPGNITFFHNYQCIRGPSLLNKHSSSGFHFSAKAMLHAKCLLTAKVCK